MGEIEIEKGSVSKGLVGPVDVDWAVGCGLCGLGWGTGWTGPESSESLVEHC